MSDPQKPKAPNSPAPREPSVPEDLRTIDGPVDAHSTPPLEKKTPPGRPAFAGKSRGGSASPGAAPVMARDPRAEAELALKTPATEAPSRQAPSHSADAARFDREGTFLGTAADSAVPKDPREQARQFDASNDGTVLGQVTFGGTADATPNESSSGNIGPYHFLKLLGEGGMGQVWLAEQSFPVKRNVALKLIRGGRYDQSVIQRFESERQSLAIMDHPAIAKVFDAGTTSDGQPFFVMEYVPGLPITKYCDEKRLDTRERLGLFIKVCEGVQHAHQKAIIHRDLKPGNILVSEIDGRPVPHIIDFGIAKCTEKGTEGETLLTQVGMLVGTPGYMAPEQTGAATQDIDTRADVYALGVILYELLTGSLPFDPVEWQKQPLHEVLRQIREDDPPRPSTQLTLVQTSLQNAELRQTDPRHLAGLLKGDLDWITMKAVEKDRARRYDSPSALAADITRYLMDEPVLASPPSFAYRTSKFVKRHRVGVLAAATVFLMLVALAISMTVQAVRIARERDRANREAVAARNVSDFLTSLFNVSDPSEARGNSITAREILDKGANQIETQLTKQPQVQARLLGTIGNVYESLGLYPQSEQLLEKARQIRERVMGPKSPEALSSTNDLARVLREEGKLATAEKLLDETLPIDRAALGPENAVSLSAMIELANVMHDQGRLPESEKLRRETLDIQQRVLGPEDPETLRTMNNLGYTLGEEGKLPEAETLLRETLELRRKVLGADHPETLRTEYDLAGYLSYDNQIAEAEKLQRETLEMRRHVLGESHPDTLASMDNLSSILQSEKHFAEAETLRRTVLDYQKKVLGPEHPSTLFTMTELANTLSVEGRYKEAETLLRATLSIQTRVLGANHPDTAATKYNLACNAALAGHRDEALAFLRDALDHGLSPLVREHMAEDSDLRSLHGNTQFEAMVAQSAAPNKGS